MKDFDIVELSNKRPKTARFYCLLSGMYLRYNEIGNLEVFCPISFKNPWKASKIKDFKLAKVVDLL